MAFNLGRARSDLAGAQDTILNGIKQLKTTLPRFTGKNAESLNQLAQFIEDKIAAAGDYSKKLTSKNTDATLERLHTTLLKLKEASDADNTEAYEKLKANLVNDIHSIISDTGKEKPKEVFLSEDDKEYIKSLIAASTLTEAIEKTTDQTSQNGLSKDDIDKALDKTIEQQKVLNNDVVDAAEKANNNVEEKKQPEDIKDELKEMFNENASDGEDVEEIKAGTADQLQKLQQMISSQIGMLNNHIRILGDNFKGSELFNYKNPFTGTVGKVPSVVDRVGNILVEMYDAIQYGIMNNAEYIMQKVGDQLKANDENKNMSVVDKLKDNMFKLMTKIGGAILRGFKFITIMLFKGIGSLFKLISSKFSKGKKKNKKSIKASKLEGLLDSLKKPKPVQLSWNTIKTIAATTASMVKIKGKKKKKRSFLNKITATLPPLTNKQKREKKKTGKLFEGIGKFMKKIGDIIKNIVKHICDIIGQIVIALCQAIAKGIGIILRAIFMTPWGLIILASILLISIGILLISLAVKKLVDYVVDDLGPIIKDKLNQIDPQTLNRFMNSVSKFIETFSSILAGAFAPLVIIGTVIKNMIGPIGDLLKTVANVVVKILKPILEGLGEVIIILLKPIMAVLKVVAKAISKILMAIMPVLEIILNVIVGLVKNILVPLCKFVFGILAIAIKAIGKIVQVIWSVLKPLFDIVFDYIVVVIQVIGKVLMLAIEVILKPLWNIIKGVVLGVLEIISQIMKEIQPIITVVVNVVIKGILLAIQAILIPIRVVIWSIKKVIDGIKWVLDKVSNWWNGKKQALANWEIGAWKFKFKPFAFLAGKSGSDDKKEAPDNASEESKKIIDDLNKRIEELQNNFNKAQEEIKTLQQKLKEAQSITISKFELLAMIINTKKIAVAMNDSIIPALNAMQNAIVKMIDGLKEVKDCLKDIKLLKQETKESEKAEQPKKELSFFDKLKAKLAEKVKDAANVANNVSSKIPGPIKTFAKFTPFGGLFNLAKKGLDFAAAKASKPKVEEIAKPKVEEVANPNVAEDAGKEVAQVTALKVNDNAGKEVEKLPSANQPLVITEANKAEHQDKVNAISKMISGGKDTKLDVTQQSVQDQFKPIQKINTVNAEGMKNISNDLDDMKAEAVAESKKNKDITNIDLKMFLMKMFENVNENFENISDKLDNPQMLPMPTPMTIANQALIGAQTI